jgi:hypothetical protein
MQITPIVNKTNNPETIIKHTFPDIHHPINNMFTIYVGYENNICIEE